ncbi:hypothetical protein [Nocardiopsis suaedae]|uniref:Large polyvalent protein associated domain-containing protein n=1 Tax=Nocardiopsis suaedae TaxID=3018444 RepID=A0ABT4TVF3_9ACTN|nr:hypothetical protein [Nocardiopsis suaedae]MDA2808642.1 hypothetical protein [Nocardiopsis suaedae]
MDERVIIAMNRDPVTELSVDYSSEKFDGGIAPGEETAIGVPTEDGSWLESLWDSEVACHSSEIRIAALSESGQTYYYDGPICDEGSWVITEKDRTEEPPPSGFTSIGD